MAKDIFDSKKWFNNFQGTTQVKEEVNEANINPKMVKKVQQFVRGLAKSYDIPETSVKLTIKQILGEGKFTELNEVRYDVRGLNDLKNNYYTISDELYDIEGNIKQVLTTTEGEEWEADKMEEGALAKELKIFGQIKKLFAKSKLGKVL